MDVRTFWSTLSARLHKYMYRRYADARGLPLGLVAWRLSAVVVPVPQPRVAPARLALAATAGEAAAQGVLTVLGYDRIHAIQAPWCATLQNLSATVAMEDGKLVSI